MKRRCRVTSPSLPFLVVAFSSSGLTYDCVYDNPGNAIVVSGDSESTNESCIGIGYFFPATGPKLCVNNLGPF
jgi:hypothetical protein